MTSFLAIQREQAIERERERAAAEEEELARALAASLVDATAHDAHSDDDGNDDDDEDDESVAKALAAREHTNDDEDASLALAMQLQAQFEHEDEARRRAAVAKQNSVYRDPLAKVQVVSQAARFTAAQRVVQDVVDGDEYDDEYDEYAEEDEANDAYATRQLADAQKAQPQLSFNMSRQVGAIGNESKHGHAVTSERNVRSIGDSLQRAGDMSGVKSGMSNLVKNQLNRSVRRAESRRVRRTNREDVATVDHVLDKQTRLKILNLLNNGTLTEMHGTIATGKESNVYHATGRNVTQFGDAAPLEELAVKIFAVSTTVFRDRQKYMHGERRFQRGNLSAAATRKFIRVWAEKEMRNLCRLRRTGIRCPTPLALRDHVLVMSFVGRDGAAAPKLKDLPALTPQKWCKLYQQAIVLLRRMFHDCGLVHSDYSAYNLLYDQGELVVIDLSHAISSDNENASQFLRDDVLHITRFFADHGAKTISPRSAFRFIVEPEQADADAEPALEKLNDDDDDTQSDTASTTTTTTSAENTDDDAASLVSIDVPALPADDATLLALRERCARRAERAAKRLAALVKAEGEAMPWARRKWTAQDEAFQHANLPRSLSAIDDEALFSKHEHLNSFNLLEEEEQKDEEEAQE